MNEYNTYGETNGVLIDSSKKSFLEEENSISSILIEEQKFTNRLELNQSFGILIDTEETGHNTALFL